MYAYKPVTVAMGLALLAAADGNAFKIDGLAPKVHFNGITNPNFTAEMQAFFEEKMNGEVEAAFDTSLAKANRTMSGFGSQKKLAQGMANANAYASNAGTLQGYPNYEHFALSNGFLLAVQAPSIDPSAYSDMGDKISDEGDLYMGLSAGYAFFNLGVNCKFLLPGLYANIKYGGTSFSIKDFSLDYKLFGFGVNYKLLEPKSFVGLVKWRGISVGTGFYMQMDELSMKVKVDTFRTEAKFREAVLAGSSGQDAAEKEAILTEMGYGPGSEDAEVLINPVFKMGLDITTFTIPVEANTAVALLWGVINLNLGLGMDLNFGNADILLEGKSDAAIEGNSTSKVTFDKATVTVDGSSKNGPSFARLRAMTGVGLGLGPVKFDIPIIYYVKSGFAFGITGAIVW